MVLAKELKNKKVEGFGSPVHRTDTGAAKTQNWASNILYGTLLRLWVHRGHLLNLYYKNHAASLTTSAFP